MMSSGFQGSILADAALGLGSSAQRAVCGSRKQQASRGRARKILGSNRFFRGTRSSDLMKQFSLSKGDSIMEMVLEGKRWCGAAASGQAGAQHGAPIKKRAGKDLTWFRRSH